MVVRVILSVIVSVRMFVGMRGSVERPLKALTKKPDSHPRNDEAGKHPENWIKPFRENETRREERDKPHREHPRCVRRRDGESEDHGVLGRSLLADQVRANNRLPVSGRERVCRSKC